MQTLDPPRIEAPPWRDRRFRVFALGNFVNNLGESAYKVGLPLYLYQLTGSLAVISWTAALAPAVLLVSPWVGALVDRWGARPFVVPGLLVQVIGAVGLNLCLLGGRVSLGVLFPLAALVQFGGELYRCGWITGVRGMFPANPGRSRAVLSSLFTASNIAGPLLVAGGLGLVGYQGLLWFDAATFLAPIAVWLLGVHPPAKAGAAAATRPGLGRELLDGWRVIRAEREVLHAELASVPLQFVSGVGLLAFLVWYLRSELGASTGTVSLTQGLANLGALAGSAYVAGRAGLRPQRVLAVAAVVMTAAPLLMAFAPTPVLALCLTAFLAARSALTATTAALTTGRLPAEVLGRAEGLFNLVTGLPLLLAPLLIPLAQQRFGPTAVFLLLGGTAALALPLVARRRPEARSQ
ncbi:MFS transporter [Kitasatospora sp. MMS16-BH015]|uniref:MFS transporter n=1 Tax=Kitasatospora sp. MMS16-BH015 TaxID=2018025 RepID=UPI000CA1266D|nr:MFS transporter [Kitasatospora sp. MMS16-BH015]AUG80995.1 MFS transporter [Kitasatospora sp. MMS16-BH015]